MTMQLSGVASTTAQLRAARADLIGQRSLNGLGNPLFRRKYTGAAFSVLLTATGDATAPALGTVPADAVGVELSVTGGSGTDYMFWLPRASMTSGGSLGANLTAHLMECFWVTGGETMVIPFSIQGTLPGTWRFAGNSATARLTGRWIAATSQEPYLIGSVAGAVTESILIGDGATTGTRQLPFSDASRFPAGTIAVQLQVNGLPMTATIDGAVPAAAAGYSVNPGRYTFDIGETGIALSALKMFLPVGCNVYALPLIAGV